MAIMKKCLAVITILSVICSFVYSNEQQNSQNTAEFEPYRAEVLKIMGELKPGVKMIIQIFGRINTREQLVMERKAIIRTVIQFNPVAYKLIRLRDRVDNNKRFAFMMWVNSVDQEMMNLSKEMRQGKQRITQIPGCQEIMNEIDSEVRTHARNIRNQRQ